MTDIHSMGVAGTYILEAELAKVTEQRDALLKACEALLAADQAGNFNMLAKATILVRAAIAKAKGERQCH